MNVSRQSLTSVASQLGRFFADLVHLHVKADVSDLETITTTPTVNAVPKADTEAGQIANGWLERTSAYISPSRRFIETDTDGKFHANLIRQVSDTSEFVGGTVPITSSETSVLDLSFIPPDIPNAKLAQMPANTTKANVTGGDAPPTNATATQMRTMLNVADGANNYVHPNHTGDVTSTGDGATVIANAAVSNAKMANMAAGTVKLRAVGAGTGVPTDGTISSTAGPARVPVANANGNFDEQFIAPHASLAAVLCTTSAGAATSWITAAGTVPSLEFIVKAAGATPVWVKFSGTSMPSSPVDGQRCYRTDLHDYFFYDATLAKWLSLTVFSMAFGKRAASVTSGTYFDQMVATGAAAYSATYGERFGFDVVVVGIAIEVGASSTCTATVQDDGNDLTGGAISLASETAKQDETLCSNTIAAGSAIGVKCTSGTASTFTNGRVRFRRITT